MTATTKATLPSSSKMTLTNLANAVTLEAQFNPTEFEESVGAVWAKQTVPGLSHQVKQFVNTEDDKFNFDLMYHAAVDGEMIKAHDRMMEARKFIIAGVHPRRADGLVQAGAPRHLFVWPTFISLTSVITRAKFRYTRFNIAGAPVAFTCSMELEEIRDTQVCMEDIFALGTQRGSGG